MHFQAVFGTIPSISEQQFWKNTICLLPKNTKVFQTMSQIFAKPDTLCMDDAALLF